jgi:hypothetical protein
MRVLIDEFNGMLASVARDMGMSHVHYVDLRRTLSSDASNYKLDWDNELHPTPRGFKRLAAKVDSVIKTLPTPGSNN